MALKHVVGNQMVMNFRISSGGVFRYLSVILIFQFNCSHDVLGQEVDWGARRDRIYEVKKEQGSEAAADLCRSFLPEAKLSAHDTILFNLYYNIAVSYYRNTDQYDVAFSYFDSARFYAERANSIDNYMYAIQAQTSFYRKSGQLGKAKSFCLEAYERFSGIPEPEVLFGIVHELAVIYRIQDRLDSALFYLLVADSLAMASGNYRILHSSNTNAALLYIKRQENQKAIDILYRSIEQAIWLSDKSYRPLETYLNLGIAYEGLPQLDSAAVYYRKTLESAFEDSDSVEIGNAYNLLAGVKLKQGEPVKALQLTKQAQFYLLKYDYFPDLMAEFFVNLGSSQLQNGYYEEAANAFRQGISNADEAKMFELKLRSQLGLVEALEFLRLSPERKFPSGWGTQEEIKTLKAAIEVQEALYETERTKLEEEFSARFQKAKNEQEIFELRLENQRTQERLSQRRKLMWLIAILFLQFVMILIVVGKRRIVARKQEAEQFKQKMLQAELNPHFMNNALHAIQSIMLNSEDRMKPARQLGKFARLMRQILQFSEVEHIRVEDEIDFLENYLSIQQLRFDEPFVYEIVVDDALDTFYATVPAMVTQIFVENAIEHGIFSKGAEGLIKIEFSKKGDHIVINVEDNGVGRDSNSSANEKIKKEHQSMGMEITRKRLELFSKRTKTFLTVENREGGGTLVSIGLPNN